MKFLKLSHSEQASLSGQKRHIVCIGSKRIMMMILNTFVSHMQLVDMNVMITLKFNKYHRY